MLRFGRLDRVILVVVALMLLVPNAGRGAPARKDRVSRSPASRQLVAQPEPAPPAPAPIPAPEKEGRPPAKRMPESPIEGRYSVDGGAEVKVTRIRGDMYLLLCPDGWEGVGILDRGAYLGVFRSHGSRDLPDGSMGYHRIDWTDLDNPSVQVDYADVRRDRLVQRWHRMTGESRPPDRPTVVAPPEQIDLSRLHRPAFGEYVYVEELPEAVTKVTPVYPDAARKAGVEGTVMVQALVLEDGTVGDCRIVGSIPMLDEAAVAAVRQWRFKPALNKGNPVAVWVAVPVKFKLH